MMLFCRGLVEGDGRWEMRDEKVGLGRELAVLGQGMQVRRQTG